jgi:hypothetical protein
VRDVPPLQAGDAELFAFEELWLLGPLDQDVFRQLVDAVRAHPQDLSH